jgi:hypothetical protein
MSREELEEANASDGPDTLNLWHHSRSNVHHHKQGRVQRSSRRRLLDWRNTLHHDRIRTHASKRQNPEDSGPIVAS